MSKKNINELRLTFHVICVDCGMRKNFNLFGGNCFNIEGDLILSNIKQVNSFYKTCLGCRNVIFFYFKKLFNSEKIRGICNGILSVKKELGEN